MVDYAAELELSRSRLLRGIYAGLGVLCVVAAVLGVFLPGWPTTIFLIISAWLFSNRVLNHRVFGPIIRDYRAGNGVPVRVKLIAISCIAIFAGSSVVFLISSQVVQLIVVAVAMFGIGFLAGLPTRKPYQDVLPASNMTSDSSRQ